MAPDELDAVYGQLANALARVGEPQSTLFLATLALDLISGDADPARAIAAIARAERLMDDRARSEPADDPTAPIPMR